MSEDPVTSKLPADFPPALHQWTGSSSGATGSSREKEEWDKAVLLFDQDVFSSTVMGAQKRLDGGRKKKKSTSDDHGCSQGHRMHHWEVKCVPSVSPSSPGCCQSSRAVAAGSTLLLAAAAAAAAAELEAEPAGAEPTRRRTPGAWWSCGRPTCP